MHINIIFGGQFLNSFLLICKLLLFNIYNRLTLLLWSWVYITLLAQLFLCNLRNWISKGWVKLWVTPSYFTLKFTHYVLIWCWLRDKLDIIVFIFRGTGLSGFRENVIHRWISVDNISYFFFNWYIIVCFSSDTLFQKWILFHW